MIRHLIDSCVVMSRKVIILKLIEKRLRLYTCGVWFKKSKRALKTKCVAQISNFEVNAAYAVNPHIKNKL